MCQLGSNANELLFFLSSWRKKNFNWIIHLKSASEFFSLMNNKRHLKYDDNDDIIYRGISHSVDLFFFFVLKRQLRSNMSYVFFFFFYLGKPMFGKWWLVCSWLSKSCKRNDVNSSWTTLSTVSTWTRYNQITEWNGILILSFSFLF